ncbi:sulfate/molybdate ABC transporter ATP-binding protein [Pseudonocardia sp. N23]|uniref:sulfate/molybdate ABC transporter ATP-binding protein n=1 Tax=Pseudonocardia sp. N23 TaxID=1987376 RepID=UPI000BFC2090|nr:ABC transporter ATP-binding protein [Pseudonocardia sp. N23]GAY08972.1 molybdenum transport ATP-binding protein ModC [Pseudonocardia sp. N23]
MTGAALAATVRLDRAAFTLDVSLDAEPGEVVAVLGPNGSGKSTLLGVLSGLLVPDAGRVAVGDTVVTDVDAGVSVPPHRRGVGLLAQQALLFPHMTALANVAFGPRAAGVPRRDAEARARTLIADVLPGLDADDMAGRRPSQMSGGQQQRVALARALAPRPGLLLLDEPLAALDVDATPAMRSLLRRVIRDAKQTAILVTHSALDALVLADRVVVLEGGRIVEQGPTREVLTKPRTPFTARIAGLDLVPGTKCPDGLRTHDGTLFSGRAGDPIAEGDDAAAVFPPSAVSVFRDRPHGSPRNVLRVTLAAIEPQGDTVRLRASPPDGGPSWLEGLAADVTLAAAADLAVEPGAELWFAVKATEVAIHPAAS